MDNPQLHFHIQHATINLAQAPAMQQLQQMPAWRSGPPPLAWTGPRVASISPGRTLPPPPEDLPAAVIVEDIEAPPVEAPNSPAAPSRRSRSRSRRRRRQERRESRHRRRHGHARRRRPAEDEPDVPPGIWFQEQVDRAAQPKSRPRHNPAGPSVFPGEFLLRQGSHLFHLCRLLLAGRLLWKST